MTSMFKAEKSHCKWMTHGVLKVLYESDSSQDQTI